MSRDESMTFAAEIGKLVLRATLGGLLIFHGIAKLKSGVEGIVQSLSGLSFPAEFAYLVYVGELVAPIFLIIGLWTRPAAVVVAINMIVAIALAHSAEIFDLSASGGLALELQAFYLLTAIAVAFLGAGRYSVGGSLGRFN
jgi:putative oxidoreductase